MVDGRDDSGLFLPGSKTASKLGSKGGRVKKPKGLATLSPERLQEIRLKGLAARKAKQNGSS